VDPIHPPRRDFRPCGSHHVCANEPTSARMRLPSMNPTASARTKVCVCADEPASVLKSFAVRDLIADGRGCPDADADVQTRTQMSERNGHSDGIFYRRTSILITLTIPAFPNDHPKTRSDMNIRRTKNAPTMKHAINCASFLILKGHLCQVTLIPHLGFGYTITLDSRIVPKVQQYMITIGSFLDCSCQYFKDMVAKALDKLQASLFCLHFHMQPRL
jgi:hypothetical protein